MAVKSLYVLFALALLINGGDSARSVALDRKVVSALESLRSHMTSGWPEAGLASMDPASVSRTQDQDSTYNEMSYGEFTSLSVMKMSDFVIDYVESNVLTLQATVGLTVPVLEISGSHSTRGAFSTRVNNFMVGLGVEFSISEEELTLEADLVKAAFLFNDMSFDGDLGDEDELLKVLEILFQQHLEDAFKYEINLALQGRGFTDNLEDDDPVDDFFDRLFADIRKLMLEDNLDPTTLPSDSDDFDVTLFNQTVNGSVAISDGSLGGLSTLHRAGNMSVRVVGIKAEVIWEGEVGFDDLEVEYTFGLDLPIFGKDLSLSLKMSYVHLSFETDVFLLRQNITLARCNITELGPIHFKEKGAGPLDTSLYDLLVNTFLGSLHKLVMEIGSEVVCGLLENVLSHV